MKNNLFLKIAVFVLSAVVILQWLLFAPKPKQKPALKPLRLTKGQIAIVLDDWGYNLNNLSTIKQIKHPLTISVLPRLSFSRTICDQLHDAGFEVIMHLPMEPREKFRLEQHTILTSMDEATVRGIISSDLLSLSHVKGVSSHMGSKATESANTMRYVFDELKKRNLYFLDSLTSTKSVCARIANDSGLLFAKRDIFLDNQEDADYIERQVEKLKKKADAYGYAIGIGHDRKVTLEVLKKTHLSHP